MNALTTSAAYAEQSLGALAIAIPGATAIFRRHRLDFCCGGSVSLKRAAAQKGLDLAELSAELGALAAAAVTPAPVDTPALISHILKRYHETHRRELPELERLARRVAAVHRDHPAMSLELPLLIEHMTAELNSHMEKEEQILFPMMLNGGHPMIVAPISMMRHEHDDHGTALRKLTEMTNDFTPPSDACNSWRALYAGLKKLADDLMDHIHLENNQLFPRYTA